MCAFVAGVPTRKSIGALQVQGWLVFMCVCVSQTLEQVIKAGHLAPRHQGESVLVPIRAIGVGNKA